MTRLATTFSASALTVCLFVGCGVRKESGLGRGSGSTATTETGAHPPIRTQYRRTDIQYNPNALQFFPPHVTAYDSIHERFFISDTFLNRIEVFDHTQQSQIASVTVPEPWGMDISADGSKLYVATTFGDVYLLDPGQMEVLQKFPSATIGPLGYIATQAFMLSDGQLALLGAMGGFYFDGSTDFAIWNPITNAITIVSDPVFGNIGQIAVTADRTKVILGGATSQKIKLYDPSTGNAIVTSFDGGNVEEILPTPDGKRILVVGLGGNVQAFDANTLAVLGYSGNIPGYSAVLSQDGSTLYTVDLYSNMFAWDSTTFAQKGWVSAFNVVDLQQAIVASSIDETGLIFGPIGHGVAFVDGSAIHEGEEQTQFNIGFLSPDFGSLIGATLLQAEILTPEPPPNITTGTVYIGNAQATNVSLSATAFSGEAPPATTGGPADFTVVLPDSSLRIMPENFSYGPTIIEVSPNAATAEGGSEGILFGYGLGQQTGDVQVTIGGQSATVTQLLTNASPTFPYPFPMEAVFFTVPPGSTGQTADVKITTADGSATASGSFQYVAADQPYPLAGASLMEGTYDSIRGVLYFTDRAQLDVFSPAGGQWLTPISIPNASASTRLYGVALSPDGNTLAISDAGNASIYVLNPSSPQSVKSFDVSEQQSGYEPGGLTVTNSGIVYYASFNTPGGNGFTAFHKLNTANGSITDFSQIEDVGQNGDDSFIRVLLSPDGSHVYLNENGDAWTLDTGDDSLTEALQVSIDEGLVEMAVSADGSTLLTSNFLTDSNLGAQTQVAYVDRDVWFPIAVYGEKLSSDGTSLFQPLTNGLDVLDGTTGLLRYRVALPIQIANVYDALAVDNADGLLFAITPTGVAKIDLTTLPSNSSKNSYRTVKNRVSAKRVGHEGRRTGRMQPDWSRRPMLRRVKPISVHGRN
ncbi:MAG TPA: IPT/TIG domain-containing protein [Candidatus Sulfotelmatobacter sp.]|nr:IPT/TIG domain-containing protein [Candidatus Sulfotelmatobacter sp.]